MYAEWTPDHVVGAAVSGVFVVRSSRVESGHALHELELGDDANLVAADRLNPQKSRVLLQLCLAHGLNLDATQQAFCRY